MWTRQRTLPASSLLNGIRLSGTLVQQLYRHAMTSTPGLSDITGFAGTSKEARRHIEGGSQASTFFHSSNGEVLLKLPEYFKMAWEEINLGTAPTFNIKSNFIYIAPNHNQSYLKALYI